MEIVVFMREVPVIFNHPSYFKHVFMLLVIKKYIKKAKIAENSCFTDIEIVFHIYIFNENNKLDLLGNIIIIISIQHVST